MKGQLGSLVALVVVAIGVAMFMFTQIMVPSRVGGLPDSLSREVATVQEEEKQSLEDQLGIDIKGDLDVVHLAFGDASIPFTLVYNNKGKEFVVIVPDPAKEDEVRETVVKWFADRGVTDLDVLNIRWHIKPNPVAFPD